MDDGQYHQIQVMRVASNASMIVDDNKMVNVVGSSKLSVFNSQSTIEIGGQLDTTDGQRTIQRPFSGKILGLKFNNMQIIEQSRIGKERNTSNVSSLQAEVPETENTCVF